MIFEGTKKSIFFGLGLTRAGWWQVKMSLTDTGIGLELLSDLKEKMNQLEKCILDKIYQYEFLLPAIQEVNKES